ncbi:MAG: hypothetical protein C0483_11335 [Pirellula sp.]|nr:hypothetical protein [Pirellula sp.]
MRILLDAGIEVNPGGNVSPLMSAVSSGTEEIAAELIARGADVRRSYPTGTALTWAIEKNRVEMATLLLRHGAHPLDRLPESVLDSRAEWRGISALEIARREKRRKISELFDRFLATGSTAEVEMATVAESWRRIESELNKSEQILKRWLSPPAGAGDFLELERMCKRPLPPDMRACWQTHNGQPHGAAMLSVPHAYEWLDGAEGLFRLLPLAEIIEEARRMQSLADQNVFDDVSVDAENGIQPVAWHKGWLPIAANFCGDLWCVDVAPAENGIPGQIILVSSESPIRTKIADSCRALFQSLEVSRPDAQG